MLDRIYQIFAEQTSRLRLVCGPGCATCCTRNVTLTTAEGRLILDALRRENRTRPELPADPLPLRPALTANGFAACCLEGRQPPAEPDSPWNFEPCFFLREGRCSIYPVRPFACRSFVSTVNCGVVGKAEAPEWLLSLAVITNQLLETLDQGGCWGNLADVLAALDGKGQDGDDALALPRLLANQPSPGLLVLPEELRLVENYLGKLACAIGLDLAGLNIRPASV